jgi:hypothetical protein
MPVQAALHMPAPVALRTQALEGIAMLAPVAPNLRDLVALAMPAPAGLIMPAPVDLDTPVQEALQARVLEDVVTLVPAVLAIQVPAEPERTVRRSANSGWDAELLSYRRPKTRSSR